MRVGMKQVVSGLGGWTRMVLASLLCIGGGMLPPGTATGQVGSSDPFAVASAPGDQELVTMRVVASKGEVRPGDQIAIGVIFDMAPGWHLHTNDPQPTPGMIRERFEPIPTVVEVSKVKGGLVGPLQWPDVYMVGVDLVGSGIPEQYGVFDGQAIVFIPLMVGADSTGFVEMELAIGWQACDDRSCMMPEDHLVRVRIPVATEGVARDAGFDGGEITPAEPALFGAFDISVFGRADVFGSEIAAARGASGAEFNVFGWRFTVDTSGVVGLALLLLLAGVGGFVLNLTPCVLPVIPIKIMGLSQAAANPAKCLMLGVVMSLGVVTFWLAIGGAITFISGFTAINTLFQQPWFSIVIAVIIAVMALGMLGLFTAGLPQWVYRINPRHDSVHGSFLFGIMTAVLSTPCTAPFMGSAAAWATQQKSLVTLATFGAIGVGMALPYLVLAANPKWVNKVPRTGPASELVKQVMGLLMLGVAVFFMGTGIGPLLMKEVGDPPLRAHWWGVAAFVVLACGLMVFKTVKITKRPVRRGVVGVLALLLASSAVALAIEQNDRGPVKWQAWTPARFEEAMATGKVVVVEFTAEWCLNCKALEASVLHRKEVAEVLNSSAVIPMKVDITAGYPEGVAFMKELKWANVPLLAFFGPGVEEPIKFDSYTTGVVLGAIQRASGVE